MMFKRIKTGIGMAGQIYHDELKAIFKDGGALLILFGALLIYPLIYAIAYKSEVVREIKTIVVDHDRSSASRTLVRMLDATEQIHTIQSVSSLNEAEKMFFDANEIGGILVIPSDFEKQLNEGTQANVSIYADGSYFLIYRQVISGAVHASGTFSAGIEVKKRMSEGMSFVQAKETSDPLSADMHFWFNPFSGYANFVMPGIILIILQQTLLIGIGMIGGTDKEKKRRSYQVPVDLKPGGIFPLLFGKALSYFTIYLVNCTITMVWLHKWFDYPERANYLHIFMLVLPYLFSIIFMGITFSVLFRRRVSSMIFMVFLSPIILFLSGISWPASSIPTLLNNMALIFPSTLMVPAYLRLRTMGAGLTAVKHEYLLLLLQCGIYFMTAAIVLYIETKHNRKLKNKMENDELVEN